MAQSLILTEPEIPKQFNAILQYNGTCDSQEQNGKSNSQVDDGTYVSHKENGTIDSQVGNGTRDSQVDNGIDHNRVDNITDDSRVDNCTDDSQVDNDKDKSQVDNGKDKSQVDNGIDDRHKDSRYKKDEVIPSYGKHETLVSEGGEADLHKNYSRCEKNPGHKQFTPVIDFNITHLPDGYHDDDLVEWIYAAADLTVRLDVRMTSTDRPEFWPNTEEPYSFYNLRGSDVLRIGTGMLYFIKKWSEKDKGTCPCHKCQHSDTPSKLWGEVMMLTAPHVVFDDIEARHTTCKMFYDRHDSPVVTIVGWTVKEADIEEDRTLLKCITCDVDLLDEVDMMTWHMFDLCKDVSDKYLNSGEEHRLIFIVSHPHGCPKQVSVGQWINRYVVGEHRTKYVYTTCTCPGSSGARVQSLGYDNWACYNQHVHSGVDSRGLNLSSAGEDWT